MSTQTNTSAEINNSATATSDKNSASVSYTNTAESFLYQNPISK